MSILTSESEKIWLFDIVINLFPKGLCKIFQHSKHMMNFSAPNVNLHLSAALNSIGHTIKGKKPPSILLACDPNIV